MKDLYERFGLSTDIESEIKKFRVKIGNILTGGKLGVDIFDEEKDNIIWRFSNKVGESYYNYADLDEKTDYILPKSIKFNEYLFRIQVLLDLLWETRESTSMSLANLTNDFINESVLDLGFFIKIYKTKSPQILKAGSKKVQKSIIATLGQLEAKTKYKEVLDHYETGMKEYLKAKTKHQLKDVVEDLTTTCDSITKIALGNNKVGFDHVFKKDNWKKLKLTELEKVIFNNLKETMNKVKHDHIKDYDKDSIENIIFLVSAYVQKAIKNGA